MTWDDVRKAVYDALVAGWSGHPTFEIFRAGQTLPDLTTRSTPFLQIKIRPRRTQQLGMSVVRSRRSFGAVEIYLFAPETNGDKILLEPLETLESLFTAQTIAGIVFTEGATPSLLPAVGWVGQGFIGSFHFDK